MRDIVAIPVMLKSLEASITGAIMKSRLRSVVVVEAVVGVEAPIIDLVGVTTEPGAEAVAAALTGLVRLHLYVVFMKL